MTIARPTATEKDALAHRCEKCGAGVGVWCWDGRWPKVGRRLANRLHVARQKAGAA